MFNYRPLVLILLLIGFLACPTVSSFAKDKTQVKPSGLTPSRGSAGTSSIFQFYPLNPQKIPVNKWTTIVTSAPFALKDRYLVSAKVGVENQASGGSGNFPPTSLHCQILARNSDKPNDSPSYVDDATATIGQYGSFSLVGSWSGTTGEPQATVTFFLECSVGPNELTTAALATKIIVQPVRAVAQISQ